MAANRGLKLCRLCASPRSYCKATQAPQYSKSILYVISNNYSLKKYPIYYFFSWRTVSGLAATFPCNRCVASPHDQQEESLLPPPPPLLRSVAFFSIYHIAPLWKKNVWLPQYFSLMDPNFWDSNLNLEILKICAFFSIEYHKNVVFWPLVDNVWIYDVCRMLEDQMFTEWDLKS